MDFKVGRITDYRLLVEEFNRAMVDAGFDTLKGAEEDAIVLVPVMLDAANRLYAVGGNPDIVRLKGDYEGAADDRELALARRCIYSASVDAIRRLEAQFTRPIPVQDTRKPNTHVTPNTKLANSLDQPDLYEEGGALLDLTSAAEKRQRRRVTEAVSINIEDSGVSFSRQMGQFDGDVHGAVASLWVAGNRCVTAAQVAQTLTGSRKPTATQISEVSESLDRQMHAFVTIDMTEEARGRSLTYEGEPVSSLVIESAMLPAEKTTIRTANGKAVEGYTLLRPPVLYRHAAVVGQVVTFSQRMLETDSAGSNTLPRVVAKNYLARRVGQIRGKGKVSNRIRLDTVYLKSGVDPDNRKARSDMNKYVESILALWAESGDIDGYTPVYGPRRRLVAFDVSCVPKKHQ